MQQIAQWVMEAERAANGARATSADRDDLVQETLLRVWERLRTRGETGVPRGLIRTVLRRLRIDAWRRRRESGPVSEALPAAGRSPLDEAAWSELRAVVRAAIADLPAAQREAVRMRFYEGRPFREIAAVQGVSLNTALGRVHLAAKRLRKALEHHGDV